MCGITGIVNNFANLEEAKKKISNMINIIGHRGPDDLCAVVGKNFCAASARLAIEKVKQKESIFVCELQECHGAMEEFYQRFKMNLNYLGEIETRSKNRLIRILQVYTIQL